MNPEIEKLIDLALVDGQITEKERNVILKKAAELGVDADEVEMILDGKLHQLEANKTRDKEKFGSVNTCPACGASAKAMELVCSECSHEFTNTRANLTIKNLELKIETEQKKYRGDGNFNEEELPRILMNFPVPNNKEDLFEVLSFMSSKVISSTGNTQIEEINAYQAKALEIITRLSLMPNIDKHVLDRVKEIEAKMKKVKSKNARKSFLESIFILIGIYLMYAFIARLFGYHFWPF